MSAPSLGLLRRQVVSRADLVRLRFHAGIEREIAARLTGFRVLPEPGSREPSQPDPGSMRATVAMKLGGTATLSVGEDSDVASPLPLWRAIGPYVEPADGQPARAEWSTNQPALRDDELGAASHRELTPMPLLPGSRLGPLLKRLLGVEREGARLDERRLVQQLATRRGLQRLPRRRRWAWASRVQLYWDQAERLAPLLADQRQVVDYVRRWRGVMGLEEVVIDGRGHAHWFPSPTAGSRYRPPRGARQADAETCVLAMSDFGLVAGDAARTARFAHWAHEATRRGATLGALVCCPRERWEGSVARRWRGVVWEQARASALLQDSRSQAQAQPAVPSPPESELEAQHAARAARVTELLTLLCLAVRIEPALLRAMRKLVPGSDVSTEIDAWLDPRVAGRFVDHLTLDRAAALELQKAYSQLPEERRTRAEAVVEHCHQRLPPVLQAQERVKMNDPALQQAGRATLEGYAKRLQGQSPGVFESAQLERWEARQAPAAWDEPVNQATWGYAWRREDGSGFDKPLPEGCSLQQVAWTLKLRHPEQRCRVWQVGPRLQLVPHLEADDPLPDIPGCQLLDLPLRAPQVQIEWTTARGLRHAELLDVAREGNVELPEVGDLEPGSVVTLTTDRARVQLVLQVRPAWALALERDTEHLWLGVEPERLGAVIEAAPLDDPRRPQTRSENPEATARLASAPSPKRVSLLARLFGRTEQQPSPDEVASEARRKQRFDDPFAAVRRGERLKGERHSPRRELGETPARPAPCLHPRPRLLWPPWARRLDEDEFGLWAEVELGEGVVTRLRWVPAGSFVMGSPKDEAGAHEHERPQHRVTLTRGYWLGEAPCTQAEWRAVMGSEPSHFKGDDARPVESVSWEDCEQFCERLRVRVPGLQARLSAEVEWEYACRAGTTSAYNDGSECTEPEGKDPALVKLGWFKENSGGQTHPVKQLKPNAYGLYDMHGNVWEWCADRFGEYSADAQMDPTGPSEGHDRVLRGGSWCFSAGFCRSACRILRVPSERYHDRGFRFAAG